MPLYNHLLKLICITLPLFSGLAHGGEITLQDGSKYSGQILKQDFVQKTVEIKTDAGSILVLPFQQIASINLGNDTPKEVVRRVFSSQADGAPYRYQVSLANTSVNYFLEANHTTWVGLEGVAIKFDHLFEDHFRLGYGAYWGNTVTGKDNGEQFELESQTNLSYLFTRGIEVEALATTTPNSTGFAGLIGLGGYFESTTQRKIDDTKLEEQVSGLYLKVGIGYQFQQLGVHYWYDIRTGQASGFKNGSSQSGIGLSLRFN